MPAFPTSKALRRKRSGSQAGEPGIDRPYISGIEWQVQNPTVTVVERIATALDCSLGRLPD